MVGICVKRSHEEMKDGKIEETGEKEAFFAKPKTEYGKLLLDSVPTLPYLE